MEDTEKDISLEVTCFQQATLQRSMNQAILLTHKILVKFRMKMSFEKAQTTDTKWPLAAYNSV